MSDYKDEINPALELPVLLRRLCDLVQRPRIGLLLSADEQDGTTRNITIQAVNRLGTPRAERFVVHVWLSNTLGGSVSMAHSVSSPTSGIILKTLTADGIFLMSTDEGGKIVLPIDVSGPATRVVNAAVVGNVVSKSLAWS